jgi:hypothetical protein
MPGLGKTGTIETRNGSLPRRGLRIDHPCRRILPAGRDGLSPGGGTPQRRVTAPVNQHAGRTL